MNDKLKIAIAGAGRAARELTLPALEMLRGEAVVTSLCDTHIERAEALVAKHPGIKAHRNIRSMLAAEKPDVLIVNTPVEAHFQVAMEAIEMGVNVIIEKPAMSTLEELEKVRAASERKGVKATVVHNYKYMPGPYDAWRMYQAGELGDILHIDRVWMSPPQNDRMERDPKGWWHTLPGGRLADSLPHHLYISYPYIGDMKVEYVDVRKFSTDRPWSKCDEAEVILKSEKAYLNIRMSTNQTSWLNKGATYHAVLWGTKRNLIVHQMEAVQMPYGDQNYWIRKGLGLLADKVKRRFDASMREPVSNGAHNRFFKAFFDHLKGKGQNPTSWVEAESVMRLTQEIGDRMEEKVPSINDQAIQTRLTTVPATLK